jgi:diaminohydroxyphosphoribosylaminopyrimidine deaminase/5-amino-6-(5-phosphoribosylamino)uracil reductase
MRRALELARRGLYTADPNPRVGCVLVNAGAIVGEGWHARAGQPHAERIALDHAGAAARGATAYVTLEPCNHTGRTGPCAAALVAAGVARVVCAIRDSNPAVAGGGLEALAQAGVEVQSGLLAGDAQALNPGYHTRATTGRPFVRSKLAVSVDGRTALATGVSQWSTGTGAREDVHRWRARSSAVVTGTGTVLADDPSMSARLTDADLDVCQPARVVIDSALRSPAQAKVFAAPGERLIFTVRPDGDREAALARQGVRIERVGGEVHCNLEEVVDRLGALEFNEVWVEAGPRLNGALLRAGLIDELVIYIAPIVLGASARGMFDLAELTQLKQCPHLEFTEVTQIGPDLRIKGRPAKFADA